MAKSASRETDETLILQAADQMKQAGDATRLKVLLALADGERCVGDMAESFDISQPSLSHHLSLMRASKAVVTRRDGKNVVYSLTARGKTLVKAVNALIDAGDD